MKPAEKNPEIFVLDNGLAVILENLPGRMSVAMGLWLPVGSRNEIKKQSGYAHFTEHMLFKGTGKRSYLDISREVDKRGGNINASTSKEVTNYYIHISSRYIQESLDVLSDMFFSSVFDAKEFETEKKVILEEIKMTEDTPDDFIFDLFFADYYGDTPMGRSIGGTIKGISRTSRDDLYDFYCRYYDTRGAVLSMAGSLWNSDSEKKDLIKSIEKLFGDERERCGDKYPPETQVVQEKSGQIVAFAHEKDLEQLHFVWALPGLPLSASGDEFMKVFTHYMGGSMSSRLVQKLREENGLCYSVGAFHSQSLDDGIWGVYVGTSAKNFPLSMELLTEEMDRILSSKEREASMEESISGIAGNFALSMESSYRVASFNAKNYLFFGKTFSLREIVSRLEMQNPEEIIRKVRDLWKDKNYHLTSLGNYSQKKISGLRKKYTISL